MELEDKKGAHRKARTEEIYLVSALDHLYVEVTGQRRSYTINAVNQTQGGPLVELVVLVAEHMCDKLQAVTPDAERDVGLFDKLASHSRSRRRIIGRIRQVRKLAAT